MPVHGTMSRSTNPRIFIFFVRFCFVEFCFRYIATAQYTQEAKKKKTENIVTEHQNLTDEAFGIAE